MPSWRSTRTASSSALKVETIANMGAYLSTFSTAVPTYLYATLLAGQYTTPLIYANVRAALTHTAPVDAYRGAGRPEATFVIESIVSKAAAELKMDPAELRRKNFIPTDRLPVPDAGGAAVRFGQLPADHRRGDQDRRLQGLRGAPRRGQVARQAARHRLLVLHRGLRPGAVAGDRPAGRRRRPVGVGADQVQPDRQRPGHDRRAQPRPEPRDDLRPARSPTSSACRSSRSRSSHGDTATTPFGMGTYGSPLAGGRRLGDHEGGRQDHRQGQEDRRPSDGGRRSPTSCSRTAPSRSPAPTRTCRSAQAVFAAYVPHNYPLAELEPGMDENAFYDPSNFVYPGRHADLRGRDRPRHRRGRGRQLHRGRRFRQHHQSDDRRGPGPWRHRPGRRPGAARERRLRQGARASS